MSIVVVYERAWYYPLPPPSPEESLMIMYEILPKIYRFFVFRTISVIFSEFMPILYGIPCSGTSERLKMSIQTRGLSAATARLLGADFLRT